MLHHCHSWWLGWGRGKKDGDEFKARIHEQSKPGVTVNALLFIIPSTQARWVGPRRSPKGTLTTWKRPSAGSPMARRDWLRTVRG